MLKNTILHIGLFLILVTGNVYAKFYAEAQMCDSSTGEVQEVVNDELFKISVCNDIKVFKEFSYCYGVEKGDYVIFHSNPDNCEMIGFTVLRNDVQCGVLCH